MYLQGDVSLFYHISESLELVADMFVQNWHTLPELRPGIKEELKQGGVRPISSLRFLWRF